MIESVENLNSILEPYAGQEVYSQADDAIFRWDPIEGWQKVEINGGLNMSLYDINKQVISQLPVLTEEQLQEKRQLINTYCANTTSTFYMLLCRDINYYTVFCRDINGENDIGKEVLLCGTDLGLIKAIDLNEDDVIEVWVECQGEVYVAFFFPYDNGVILCK